MALCDAASKGTPIPETLPPELGKAGAAMAAKPVAQESGGRLGLEEERRRNMEKGEFLSKLPLSQISNMGLKSCLRVGEMA